MKKKWLIPGAVAVIVAAAVAAAFFLSRPEGNTLYASVSVTATEQTDQGVSATSAFTITTDYSVTQDELRAMLRIEPPVGDFTMSGRGKTWTLTPGIPLEDNTVYTVRVVNPETVETVQSFAFQTRSDLLVGSVYPEHESTYVPPESGIEITFNATGVDVTDYFEIKPEISGTFSTSDFTAIFRPNEPLAPDSIYRVTIKAGLTAPDGAVLREDYAFSFETNDDLSEKDSYRRLRLDGEYSETFLTGDTLAVALSSGEEVTGLDFEVTLHKFADINGYMKELRAHDAYYAERYGEKTEYVANTTGLEQVVSFTGPLFQKGESRWDGIYAILPDDLPEGHYIVTISGKNAEGREQFVQKLIQIRNLSVYAQSVDGDSLIWLNDPGSGEALGDTLLKLEDADSAAEPLSLTTQADGAARIMTGEMKNAYLSLVQNGKTTYFEKVRLSPSAEPPLSESYYTALYTDREIYQPDDTIRFWGVVRPRRITASLPEAVYATLSFSWPESEIYRVRIPVNADGTYEGEIPVSGLKQDWYSFSITDGEKGVYTSNGYQIAEYTKPPYLIDIEADKKYGYIGDSVTLNLSAAYFDGTPVAGGKLRVTGGGSDEEREVTLDAEGRASYTTTLDMSWRTSNPDVQLSWQPQNLWFSVSSADPEDVQITEQTTVLVLPSRVAIGAEGEKADSITIRTARIDESKLLSEDGAVRPIPHGRAIQQSEYERLAGAPVDVPVTLTVHKRTFTQEPVGSYYDTVNKRTVTRYKSVGSTAVVKTLQVNTAGGTATVNDLPVSESDNEFYWVEARVNGGVVDKPVVETRYFYDRGSERRVGEKSYTFHDPADDAARQPFDLGQPIPLALYESGVKVPNEGRVLYSVVQRKALGVGVFHEDGIQLEMHEDLLPNAVITGAYFDGRHVYTIENYNISYNYEKQGLKITAEADKESYRPGEQATITLTVTDLDGNPTAASACVGVVDEAVFTLAPQEVDLLGQVYRTVYYPYVSQKVSYREYDLEKALANSGGGGGGGGGDAPIRKDFVDTALFRPVTVDAAGKAAVTLTLPDNVTSWRITAAAVTDGLKAGDTTASTVATLPFYLTPLFTDTCLEGDDIVIAAGAVGTATTPGEPVDYTVTISDAQGKEIDKLTATGRTGARTAFNFGKYNAGQYTMLAQGSCGGNSDAVKQEFSVVKQGMTVPVIRTMPIDEVSGLTPVRYPVTLNLYDERMKPYMDGIRLLSGQTGDRTELLAASYLARVAYNDLLDPEDRQPVRKDYRLNEIQKVYEDGGVRQLPFSEGDAAVTAKMLVAAPELVNKGAARTFLQKTLRDPAATPDDRVMAYLGLAALKQPVLLDINRMLEENPELTAAQRLCLGAGLAELGDFTGAEKLYAALGEKLVTESAIKYVEGDGSADSRLQNTAAALMLTSLTANPDADALMRYMNALDQDRAKSYEVLVNLEMLTYLENFTVPSGKDSAKFTYTADGALQEVTLGDKGFKSLSMSAEAFGAAGFKQTGGTVYAGVSYLDYADESGFARDNRLSVTKTYTTVGGGELTAAKRVRVDLFVRFAEDAPSGCYNVTDFIPSGMRYVKPGYGDISPYNDWCWSRIENEGQTVRGYIFRDLGQMPTPEERAELDEEMGVAEAAMPGNPGGWEDLNSYVLSYYVSAAMPGSFVIESAYVTPESEGIAAKSDRGRIVIGE